MMKYNFYYSNSVFYILMNFFAVTARDARVARGADFSFEGGGAFFFPFIFSATAAAALDAGFVAVFFAAGTGSASSFSRFRFAVAVPVVASVVAAAEEFLCPRFLRRQ